MLSGGLGIRNLDSQGLKVYGVLGNRLLYMLGFSLYGARCMMGLYAMDIRLLLGGVTGLFYSPWFKNLACVPGGRVASGPGIPGRSSGGPGRDSRLSIKAGDMPARETGQLSTGKRAESVGKGGIPLERVKIDYNTLLSFTKGIYIWQALKRHGRR